MELEVPDGSVYFWMYTQGLAQVPLDSIEEAVEQAGKQLRDKDIENYWNGWYRHNLYQASRDIMSFDGMDRMLAKSNDLTSYPIHPLLDKPEILNRWVPCSSEGKPLFKWGKGCLTKVDAMCMRGCKTLAENLKGTKFLVIDCDGDHDKQKLDLDTIEFMAQFRSKTHCLSKPKKCWEYGNIASLVDRKAFNLPASFHLTFITDRVIPTMHFPHAHVDIIGNKMNSLRYLKNKEWNGIEPIAMTPGIWRTIMEYIDERK